MTKRSVRKSSMMRPNRIGSFAVVMLAIFLNCDFPTVQGSMSDQDNTSGSSSALEAAKRALRKTDSPTAMPTRYPTRNDKNNRKNDQDERADNQWSRPWDVTVSTDHPTDKPSKAPTTPKPTKAPTTSKPTRLPTPEPTSEHPTWPPVTRWPTQGTQSFSTTTTVTPRPTVRLTAAPYPTRLPTTPSPTKAPTTKKPTRSPTPVPTTSTPSMPPTRRPTDNPTGNPTDNPTTKPTANPTIPPTVSRTVASVPDVQTTSAPTLATEMAAAAVTPAPTTPQPVSLAPTAAPTKTKLNKKDLPNMQVVPFGSNIFQTVSVALSVWFPDRSGVNEAEHDSMSASVKTALSATLEYLFCDSTKDHLEDMMQWEYLGLKEYSQEHRLCAFAMNVVQGDGVVGALVEPTTSSEVQKVAANGGGRTRLLQGNDNNNLQAYEEGKWDPDEWKDIDAAFVQWEQENRAGDGGGQAIYAVEPYDSKDEKNNQDNKDNGDKDNDRNNQNKDNGNNKNNDNRDNGNNKNNGNNKDDRDQQDNKNQQDNRDNNNRDQANEERANDQRANENRDKQKNNNKKNEDADIEVADSAVLLAPPHLHPHVHFHAHKNLAYAAWNVSWPVVRLSVKYLEKAWKQESEAGVDVTADHVFSSGVKLMQQDLRTSLQENVKLRVLDVILEELLQEKVRVSLVGHEGETFGMEIILAEGDHMGYNMTAAEKRESLNPHPMHLLRLTGITLLLFTLKFIAILIYLSRKRKLAREAELKRHREGKGMLQVNGVEEMLKKTKTARRDVIATLAETHRRSRHDINSFRREREYEMRIPMPMNLKPRSATSRASNF